MPVTKSAKKKLRKDIKREKENLRFEKRLKKTLKEVTKTASPKKVSEATKLIDKAVKKHIIHSNKGGRLKSMLAGLDLKQTKSNPSKTLKKASKK